MFPYNEALIMASIKERQAEIQREFERYHLARATRAAQPPRPPRLAGLLQCVRRPCLLAVPERGVGYPDVRRDRLRNAFGLESNRRYGAVGKIRAEQVRLRPVVHDAIIYIC